MISEENPVGSAITATLQCLEGNYEIFLCIALHSTMNDIFHKDVWRAHVIGTSMCGGNLRVARYGPLSKKKPAKGLYRLILSKVFEEADGYVTPFISQLTDHATISYAQETDPVTQLPCTTASTVTDVDYAAKIREIKEALEKHDDIISRRYSLNIKLAKLKKEPQPIKTEVIDGEDGAIDADATITVEEKVFTNAARLAFGTH